MIIFEKVVMSEVEPSSSSVLWLKNTKEEKGLYGFGPNGWEELCNFNTDEESSIEDIKEKLESLTSKVDSLGDSLLVWKEA